MAQIHPTHLPLSQTSAGARKDHSEKQVLERKKPGLKPGQKIRSARKLKPAQIEAIIRSIRGHALDNPETPLTYSELAEKFQSSAVTLRSKTQIKAAMEETRAAASVLRESRKSEIETDDETGIKAEEALAELKKEVRELKLEVENYRRDHQLLTLYFHTRGESLEQVLAQANASMASTVPSDQSAKTRQPTMINPISRR